MTAAELLERLVRILGATATPRLALSPAEAARALGVSRTSFDRYVRREIRVVRRGKLVLVPVSELEKWVAENAALTLDDA